MNVFTLRENIIKSLRSNKYIQIKGQLSDGIDNHACFLGVCYLEAGVSQSALYKRHGVISWGAMERLQKDMEMTTVNEKNIIGQLVIDNDAGISFREIADKLVKELKFPDIYPTDYINEHLDSLETISPPNKIEV